MRLVRTWNRLPREVVMSLSLEVSQIQVEQALSNLLWLGLQRPGWDSSKVLSNFNNSLVLWCGTLWRTPCIFSWLLGAGCLRLWFRLGRALWHPLGIPFNTSLARQRHWQWPQSPSGLLVAHYSSGCWFFCCKIIPWLSWDNLLRSLVWAGVHCTAAAIVSGSASWDRWSFLAWTLSVPSLLHVTSVQSQLL